MARRGTRQVELTIDALTDDGLGEGRYESRTVRARNALPGETVAMAVRKRQAGIWYGEAEQPENPAAARQHPACSAFPRCAGCALQHLDYQQQLEHKTARVLAELAQAGVEPAFVRPPVSAKQFHYRYKARLGVRVVGDEVLIGFREGFNSRIARVNECRTLAHAFVAVLPALKDALQRLRRPDRIPQVELAGGDREVAIVVRHLTDLDQQEQRTLLDFARSTGTRVHLQPGGYDTVWRLDVGGEDYLSYALSDFGLCYRFLPTDFVQVNPFINRALVRAALLALAPQPESTVADLFCGIGNFSLALARQGVRVRGIESSVAAVERARFNALVNGLHRRAEFAVADLYDARCPSLPEAEYLLLDPPRSGAGPNLQRWASSPRLERIAYVSCNPRTFAADATVLFDRGFNLQEVGIFDMFPHTAHVETLGMFARSREALAHG